MPKATVNGIFRENGAAYRKLYPKTPIQELKVMRSIAICRTEEAGVRIERCDNCRHKVVQNNSCRNRHCPQCQNTKKEEWIAARKNEVIPVTYFHIVFTVPDILNDIIWRNKKLLFDLMFKMSRQTLISIAAEEKYFGADVGFFAALHTWGQKLNRHPHIHCVFPGGGFSKNNGKWKHLPYDYLAPIEAIKTRYKMLFLENLKMLYSSGKLFSSGGDLDRTGSFQRLIDELYAKEWVVFLKESFKNSSSVIEYLARYTHKIAIGNYRILSADGEFVEFTYRDYRDGNREKIMRMDTFKFMCSFLSHTLSRGFVKIRYFGIFSHRNKAKSLKACRELYGILEEQNHPTDWREILKRKTGKDFSACPVCGTGRLIFESSVPARYRAPP